MLQKVLTAFLDVEPDPIKVAESQPHVSTGPRSGVRSVFSAISNTDLELFWQESYLPSNFMVYHLYPILVVQKSVPDIPFSGME